MNKITQIGTIIDNRYEILSLVSTDVCSLRFLAKDRTLDKEISLIIFKNDLIPGTKTLNYLENLIQKCIDLNHNNCVDIIDYGYLDNKKSIFYIENGKSINSLKKIINNTSNEPISIIELCNYLIDIIDGVIYLSDKNFLVSTLNPDTIFLYDNNQIRISPLTFISNSQIIRDHSVQCKVKSADLKYIAPEMIFGNTVFEGNLNSVSYFFGVLAFQMITGVPPFDANSETLMEMHKSDSPPIDLLANVPSWYSSLIIDCLKKDEKQRPSINSIKERLKSGINQSKKEKEWYPDIINDTNYHVLFVEDNKLDQLSFARSAKKKIYNFSYMIAKNIEKAKQLLDSNSFDCIVSDYMLPDGTALDVISYAASTPVIVVSGTGKKEVITKTLEAGAVEFISKEIRYEHLDKIPLALKKVFTGINKNKINYSLISLMHKIHLSYSLNKISRDINENLNNFVTNDSRVIRSSSCYDHENNSKENLIDILLDEDDILLENFNDFYEIVDSILPVISSGKIRGLRIIKDYKTDKLVLSDKLKMTKSEILGFLFLCLNIAKNSLNDHCKIGIKLLPDILNEKLELKLLLLENNHIISNSLYIAHKNTLFEYSKEISEILLGDDLLINATNSNGLKHLDYKITKSINLTEMKI